MTSQELLSAMNEQERYLDTGDHTVTIDPINRDAWITYQDDGYYRHQESMLKGLAFDRRAMQEAKTIVEARHSRPSLFMPTTGVIDGMDKFAEPMKDGCRGVSWRGYIRDSNRYGLLPTISQMLYDNSLINKSVGDIEHEMREANRTLDARMYLKDGRLGQCR